ncbi:ankyrin repeat domain-containing protein [Kaarinaea lacus]
MKSVNPKLLIVLVLVIVFAGAVKLMNPHKKYSTQDYWKTATLDDVARVPEEALKVGNKNGGVLMWAATSTSDPAIIAALVERGADVNESDPVFSGTPLTGAAGYNDNPEILKELVRLGADIHKRVNNQETVLMIAAQYNNNAGIIEELVSLGANLGDKNAQGETALDLAKKNNNKSAEVILEKLMP